MIRRTCIDALLAACLFIATAGAMSYYVSTTGNDNTGDGSSGKPWATLRKACASVSADKGDTIRLGTGSFNANLTDMSVTLPRGVNLIGNGQDNTKYAGNINVPEGSNQVMAGFYLDGSKNKQQKQEVFPGLIITKGDHVEVRDLHIEGFWGNALHFGEYDPGMTNSSLHDCKLINNGVPTAREFGMRTGDLTNCEIHHLFIRERVGLGGEPWNTGNQTFTNVKVHDLDDSTHTDVAAGWDGQPAFNFEWWNVNCTNCEIYNCRFNGSISLVTDGFSGGTPYSIRLHHNTWVNLSRFAIEIATPHLDIDSNYFQFSGSDADQGAYAVCANWGSGPLPGFAFHHNIVDNVPLQVILTGNTMTDVAIDNNTIVCGTTSGWFGGDASLLTEGASSGWKIRNNIYVCDPSRPGRIAKGTLSGLIISNNCFVNITDATGLDASNKIGTDPRLLKSGNKPTPWFTLTGASPCINAGMVIAGVTNGYSGSAPDIGAYEYMTTAVRSGLTVQTRSRTSGGVRGLWSLEGRQIPAAAKSAGQWAASVVVETAVDRSCATTARMKSAAALTRKGR